VRQKSPSPIAATVVVTTCDRLPHLAVAVEALDRQTFGNFEILVVENGPERGARSFCTAKDIRYVHEPRIGLSRARNTAARAALGDIVAYIDDDAAPQADWLERLMAPFLDPSIGVVTGTIQYMKARGTSRAMSAEIDYETHSFRGATTISRKTPRWFCTASFGGIGDGSNMAFRRKLVEQGTLFDERLGRGCRIDGGEEHVAFVRVLGDGHHIAHVPDAIVLHPFPADADARRARLQSDIRSSVAYVLYLYSQFPLHRRELYGFILRAIAKRIGLLPRKGVQRLPWPLALAAVVRGFGAYWMARADWQAVKLADRELAQTPLLEEARTLE
jgi:GT2 family glycosyltransferase